MTPATRSRPLSPPPVPRHVSHLEVEGRVVASGDVFSVAAGGLTVGGKDVVLHGTGAVLSDALDAAVRCVPQIFRPAQVVFRLKQGLGDGRDYVMTAVRDVV